MTDKLSPIQEQLLSRADAIFASIAEAVGQAKGIAVEQLPDIAYQYIAFNRAYLTFVVVMSVAIWVSFQVFCIRWANKACLDNYHDKGHWNESQGIPYSLGTFTLTFLCGMFFLANIKDFFMVWFAPKIFLIEHLVNLVKG